MVIKKAFNDGNERLVRAVWPNQVKSDGTIKSSAFKPRENEGVSTDRSDGRPIQATIDFLLKNKKPESKAASVTVEQCYSINLRLEHEPRDDNPFHSGIYSQAAGAPLDSIEYKKLACLAILVDK